MKKMLLDKIQSAFVWLYYFCRFVIRQFIVRRGLQTASSLAYTTLLSIVPLVGVMFSFFGNVSVFKDISEVLQEFIFSNFVPAFGETIEDYLISFSIAASKLTTTGIAVLVVIALLMMSTIESALNHIWNVLARRKPIARFLVYWAILTLGPVLIGASLYATSYLLALPLISSVDESLMITSRLLVLLPVVTTGVAFSFMYILIPNCYVNWRDAVLGGVIAALFFEMAKYSFGVYVKSVPTYQVIYGAIAVIPMFLIWVYVSWLIVLLGAQIAYSLSVFRLNDAIEKRDKHQWEFFDAFKIVAELWQAQKDGKQLTSAQIKRRGIRIPHLMLNEILELFRKANWVHRTSAGTWILSRDINELTLLDLYQLLPCKFPEKITSPSDKWRQALEGVINSQSNDLRQNLSVSLGELFRKAE
jgi:membrane protein